MYARAVQTFTLVLFLATSSLVSASPAPIDSQLAKVLAENRNAACSAPGGCVGLNGTIAANTESGASRSVALSSGAAVAAAVALVGLL
ncbi:hypothetical protein C8Q76DRAFT_791507 [Earliella scabrosa]|nr:hypothetical protein C8Q76DRAFT_791507 [Earliella scabrosa]